MRTKSTIFAATAFAAVLALPLAGTANSNAPSRPAQPAAHAPAVRFTIAPQPTCPPPVVSIVGKLRRLLHMCPQ